MQAQPGITYAQIKDGKVRWLFTAPDLPEWPDVTEDPTHPYAIQVVPAAPGVEVGDLYADGAFSKPPAPAPSVPQVVSRFQAKAALLRAGLLDNVEALMGNPATPAIARLAWTEAIEFRRDSPTVLAMAAALQLTEAQLDALFVDASTLTA